MIKFYVTLDDKKKICNLVYYNNGFENDYVIPKKNPELLDCFEIDIDEYLNINSKYGKIEMFIDSNTREITNDKGEIMFAPGIGSSSTYTAGSELKVYVDKISEKEAEKFRKTLFELKNQDDHVRKLQEELQSEINKLMKNLSEHETVVCELHDKLGKILAISGYNEFKNKIHVDKNGEVFIIDKHVHIPKECVE